MSDTTSNNTPAPQIAITAPLTEAMMQLLTSIEAKLTELVAIETYLANKVTSAPQPAPVADIAVHAAPTSVAAAPAPAQAAAPATPPSRPGAGTIGGLVWDYCDGLSRQLGAAPTKEQLLEAIKQYSPTFNGQPVNELTASTQYSKWRAANGLPRLPRGFGAQKAAQPEAAPAPASVAQPVPAFAVPAAPSPSPTFAPPVAPAPIPAAVPSVVAPTAVPAVAIPPWLRAQG